MTLVPLRDVMDRDYVGVNESDDLRGAVALLRENDADAAVVLRGGDPVGLLTAVTVLDRVAEGDVEDSTVGDAMIHAPPALGPAETLADAAARVTRDNVDHLLVADDTGLLGVVGVRDLAVASRGDIEASSGRQPGAPTDDRTGGGATEFSTQGVCEVCGSLAESLSNVNGQLVCADCHDI